ncbi:hypothetical protein [Spiroplasma sp. BIUS-1]|uniref:hypothetical protein n=1 Tax=Spiroplasma sp. BIUS-1 TaxID=216964 RepID=UPI0013987B9C|nr:hypothetical protein [Spiroplasma sp. BIUS-1]QHX36702.1 hypothetical protein SBIUS_v1c04490 [Spiroplasma sp. BIUS-1]
MFKKIFTLIGGLSILVTALGQSSSLQKNTNPIKYKNNSLYNNGCSCKDNLINYTENYWTYGQTEIRISQLNLSEYVLNAYHDAFMLSNNLHYEDMLELLEALVPAFRFSPNIQAKEAIAKVIIGSGFKYANKSIGGITIRVSEEKYGEDKWFISEITLGVFDSIKAQPLQQEIYSDIKFNKAFNTENTFKYNDKKMKTQGIMSYHFTDRFVKYVPQIRDEFSYIAFPEAKINAYWGLRTQGVQKTWDLSDEINGNFNNFYTSELINGENESYSVSNEFEKVFFEFIGNYQLDFRFKTNIKVKFEKNEEFDKLYDIYLENEHFFENNVPNYDSYMTIDYKINDKIEFYNKVDLQKIDSLYYSEINNRANYEKLPPVGGSPFISRLNYTTSPIGRHYIELHLNQNGLQVLDSLRECAYNWVGNNAFDMFLSHLKVLVPQLAEYTEEEQRIIVSNIIEAIKNRFGSAPGYIQRFISHYVNNPQAVFGVVIIASNLSTPSPETFHYRLEYWNSSPWPDPYSQIQ